MQMRMKTVHVLLVSISLYAIASTPSQVPSAMKLSNTVGPEKYFFITDSGRTYLEASVNRGYASSVNLPMSEAIISGPEVSLHIDGSV